VREMTCSLPEILRPFLHRRTAGVSSAKEVRGARRRASDEGRYVMGQVDYVAGACRAGDYGRTGLERRDTRGTLGTVGVELPPVSLRFQARVESTSSACDGKASAADLGLQRVAAELNYPAIFRTLASRVLPQPFFPACGRVPPDRNALAPPVDFGSQSLGVYSMLFRQRPRRHRRAGPGGDRFHPRARRRP